VSGALSWMPALEKGRGGREAQRHRQVEGRRCRHQPGSVAGQPVCGPGMSREEDYVGG
jgi:hypothetical protein